MRDYGRQAGRQACRHAGRQAGGRREKEWDGGIKITGKVFLAADKKNLWLELK